MMMGGPLKNIHPHREVCCEEQGGATRPTPAPTLYERVGRNGDTLPLAKSLLMPVFRRGRAQSHCTSVRWLCVVPVGFHTGAPADPYRKRAQGFVVVRYRRRCGPAGGRSLASLCIPNQGCQCGWPDLSGLHKSTLASKRTNAPLRPQSGRICGILKGLRPLSGAWGSAPTSLFVPPSYPSSPIPTPWRNRHL